MSLKFEDFVSVREAYNPWDGPFVELKLRVVEDWETEEILLLRRDVRNDDTVLGFIRTAFEWGYRAAMNETRSLREKEQKENQQL